MMDARHLRLLLGGGFLAAGLVACAAGDEAGMPADDEAPAGGETVQVALGPVDGHDLPAADLERVVAGGAAPDFTALSSTGEPVTLSDYRGEKNVILFFYRGHW